MKLYENLANGVVTLVPTPRYLRELMDMDGFVLTNLRGTFKAGEDWYKYIEEYSEDLKVYRRRRRREY